MQTQISGRPAGQDRRDLRGFPTCASRRWGQAVQLFDSWAGALSAAEYRRFALPHSTSVLSAVADLGVPRIHFGVGTGELLALMGAAGAEVVGVDWRVPLDEAARRVPGRCKATSIRLCSVRAGPLSNGRCAGSSPRDGLRKATCSTSATAFCPRPTRMSWRAWSRRFTPPIEHRGVTNGIRLGAG